MKKLLSSVSTAALLLCFSLNIVQAMDVESAADSKSIKRKREEGDGSDNPTPTHKKQKISVELIDFYPESPAFQAPQLLTFHKYVPSPVGRHCGDSTPDINREDSVFYPIPDIRDSADSDDDEDIGGAVIHPEPTECFLTDLLLSKTKHLLTYDICPNAMPEKRLRIKVPGATIKIVQLLCSKDRKYLSQVNRKWKRIVDFATVHLKLLIKEVDPQYFWRGDKDVWESSGGYLDLSDQNGNRAVIINQASQARTYTLHLMNFLNLFEQFPNLTSLNFNGDVGVTGGTLRQLPHLQRLKLGENTPIGDAIVCTLTNLTHLNLAGNKVVTDNSVSRLTNLTNLDLECNTVVTDESVSKLTNLTDLNLSRNNHITGKTVTLLTNLERLKLHTNKAVPDNLSHLTKLTYLSLSRNDVITDQSLSHLTNLTYLDLCDNSRVTDNSVSHLSNLKILELCETKKITQLSVNQLSQLEDLRLEDWYDLNIGECVKALPHLKKLRVFDEQNEDCRRMPALVGVADHLFSLLAADTKKGQTSQGFALKERYEKRILAPHALIGVGSSMTAITYPFNIKALNFNLDDVEYLLRLKDEKVENEYSLEYETSSEINEIIQGLLEILGKNLKIIEGH